VPRLSDLRPPPHDPPHDYRRRAESQIAVAPASSGRPGRTPPSRSRRVYYPPARSGWRHRTPGRESPRRTCPRRPAGGPARSRPTMRSVAPKEAFGRLVQRAGRIAPGQRELELVVEPASGFLQDAGGCRRASVLAKGELPIGLMTHSRSSLHPKTCGCVWPPPRDLRQLRARMTSPATDAHCRARRLRCQLLRSEPTKPAQPSRWIRTHLLVCRPPKLAGEGCQ
jgi:hypothetical protein